MMISPSSESHQQVVAVGQPLAVQPQGTVMVIWLVWVIVVTSQWSRASVVLQFCTFQMVLLSEFLFPGGWS